MKFKDANGKEIELNDSEVADRLAKFESLNAENGKLKNDHAEAVKKLGEAESLFDEEYLSYLADKKKGGKPTVQPSDKGVQKNFDEMSLSELYNTFNSEMGGKMEGLIKAFDSRLASFDNSIGEAFAKIDLRITGNKYGQAFWDRVKAKDIDAVLKENPNWSAERAYEELLDKDKLSSQKKEEEKREVKEKELKAFSEKGELPASVANKNDLSAEEAANLAYDATIGAAEKQGK